MKNIKRGDIFYADLTVTSCGCEQSGIRPVIVVQNNVGNYHSPTVIVAAITSKLKKNMPTHIVIQAGEGNLNRTSMVLLEQLSTIDKSRLIRFVGNVAGETMEEINQAMLISLGLSCA